MYGGIIAVLNCNQTFNADVFSEQQQNVHENLPRKRSALVKRKNARIPKEKILDFGVSAHVEKLCKYVWVLSMVP